MISGYVLKNDSWNWGQVAADHMNRDSVIIDTLDYDIVVFFVETRRDLEKNRLLLHQLLHLLLLLLNLLS